MIARLRARVTAHATAKAARYAEDARIRSVLLPQPWRSPKREPLTDPNARWMLERAGHDPDTLPGDPPDGFVRANHDGPITYLDGRRIPGPTYARMLADSFPNGAR